MLSTTQHVHESGDSDILTSLKVEQMLFQVSLVSSSHSSTNLILIVIACKPTLWLLMHHEHDLSCVGAPLLSEGLLFRKMSTCAYLEELVLQQLSSCGSFLRLLLEAAGHQVSHVLQRVNQATHTYEQC